MVDTATGSCTVVPLSPAAQAPAPVVGGWSCRGLLLAVHRDAEGVATASVINWQGEVVACSAVPGLEPASLVCSGSWAPDGTTAALFAPCAQHFWLWDGRVSKFVRHEFTTNCLPGKAVWSHDAHTLYLSGTSADKVVAWSGKGMLWQDISSDKALAAGSQGRVAAFPQSQRDGSKFETLEVFKAGCSGFLAGIGSLSLQTKWRFSSGAHLAVSPDGAFVAAVTCSSEGWGVAVSDWEQVLQHHKDMGFPPDRLAWAADGASLLASSWDGTKHLLLDFA